MIRAAMSTTPKNCKSANSLNAINNCGVRGRRGRSVRQLAEAGDKCANDRAWLLAASARRLMESSSVFATLTSVNCQFQFPSGPTGRTGARAVSHVVVEQEAVLELAAMDTSALETVWPAETKSMKTVKLKSVLMVRVASLRPSILSKLARIANAKR